MTEPARLARNAQRLTELHPVFRRRVSTLIAQLEADGFRPRIQEAWRPPDVQLQKFREGKSKVKWGFHCATSPDGLPEALAVDLLDDDAPLVPPRRYLLKLAAHAKRVQCQTGLAWGLAPALREKVEAAVTSGHWGYVGPVGWDPCHVEPVDVTVAQARHGQRPTDAVHA